MRIVQIIDSLNRGGAERMAISFANALAYKIEFSGLIATRKEGQLLSQIDKNVSYLFLKKEKKIDFKAVLKLRKYLKKNKVQIIHAHGSSFFIAVLVKITFPEIKIIWHDHYGTRVKESLKENIALFFLSVFFNSIFVVNTQLEKWNSKNLLCKSVFFIPNFSQAENGQEELTNLEGSEEKKIIFLANLKKPKNHIVILKAFLDLKLQESGWSLHLIGKDYFDSYSKVLKDFIDNYSLGNHIHLYGEKNDIKYILSQGSLGVLASTEEGFPVTLLEYALANLAVVSTKAGYCSTMIENEVDGLLFDPLNQEEVKLQLQKITENDSLRESLANNFTKTVSTEYSEEMVIRKLILAYKNSR